MRQDLVFFIVGIVLILLSYVSLKFAISINIPSNNNKEKPKRTIKDELLTPSGNASYEVVRYAMVAVGLFVVGVFFLMIVIAHMIGADKSFK